MWENYIFIFVEFLKYNITPLETTTIVLLQGHLYFFDPEVPGEVFISFFNATSTEAIV